MVINLVYVLIVSLLILIPTCSIVFGEHIFYSRDALAQNLDIAQLTSEKYSLKFDEKSYDVYYGYHGSFEVDVNAPYTELPHLTTMNINSERKSLEITMDGVTSRSVFWVRLPFEVISAEDAQYRLLIDGVDTKYDLTKFPDSYALGMIMPENSKNIEIIGTHVIPEFGALAIMTFGLILFGIIYFVKKSNSFGIFGLELIK